MRYYIPSEAAKVIRCSDDHVRTLIADGSLVATNISQGKKKARWIIAEDDLRSFIANRRSDASAASKRGRRRKPTPKREWV